MNRAQLAFSVLALVIVFSLVVTALGSAVFDALTDPGTDDTIIVSEDVARAFRVHAKRWSRDCNRSARPPFDAAFC